MSEVPAVQGSFSVVDPKTLAENLAENFEGLTPQLMVVKVPSGGSTAFDVDEEMFKTIEGVVTCHYATRVLFLKKYGEGSPAALPDCFSLDGKKGQGKGDGACIQCKYNQFGSYAKYVDPANTSNRIACAEKHRIFILRTGEILPILISLPQSSKKPLELYITKLTQRGKGYRAVLTEISLEKAASKQGIEYSKAKFRKVGDLDEATTKAVLEMAKSLDQYCRTQPVEVELTPPDEDFPHEEE